MRLLWISRMGYQCSYNYVSNIFLSNLIKTNVPNLEIFAYATGIVNSSVDHIHSETGVKKENIHIIKDPLLNSNNIEDQEYFNNYFSGIYHLINVVKTVRPDIIISLDDSVVIENQLNILSSVKTDFTFKFIPYLTIDHELNTRNIFEKHNLDTIMTMTLFAKKQIENASREISVPVLYHIVDQDTFYPLDKKPLIKKWGLPEAPVQQGLGSVIPERFIVGAFNANNVRKRWDILLEGFGMFASGTKNTTLLIKVPSLLPSKDKNGLTQCAEYNLNDLIKQTKIKYNLDEQSIIVIEGEVTIPELNELYNCCNVGLTTTSGEGFGLTPCEMALCNIPQIVPNYSSFIELFQDTKGLMPVDKYPIYVGRHLSLNEFTNLSQSFACIYKSYIYHSEQTETTDNLSITSSGGTSGIPTFILSENKIPNINLNIVGVFSTFIELIKTLTSLNHHRYQVLINLDTKFLSKEFPNYKKLTDIKWDKRKNYIVRDIIIDRYYDNKYGETGIPNVITVSNYLKMYYNDELLRISDGKKCREHIIEKCNKNVIINKYLEFLASQKLDRI